MTSTVLVTGGTGALGTSVTERLLSDEHRVAATYVIEEEADRLVAAVGRTEALRTVRADVTDPASIELAVKEVDQQLGPIDALVHLVGAWSGNSPVHEHSVEDWNKMLALNLTSAFLTCRAVLPGMLERDRGRIVLVSSRTTELDRAGQVAYAVAKSGVEVLAETIAEEAKRRNVTANVIAPSTLDTAANRRAMPGADTSRWVTTEKVAAAISFLLSEPAGALRAARLPIYGGV